MDYTPRTELDYGNLLCWGENSIGVQRQACIYHIIPAGPPDPVHNCTVFNQTFTAMQISCGSGFDGGLKQMFKLDLRDARSGHPVVNMSQDKSEFLLQGLLPGIICFKGAQKTILICLTKKYGYNCIFAPMREDFKSLLMRPRPMTRFIRFSWSLTCSEISISNRDSTYLAKSTNFSYEASKIIFPSIYTKY